MQPQRNEQPERVSTNDHERVRRSNRRSRLRSVGSSSVPEGGHVVGPSENEEARKRRRRGKDPLFTWEDVERLKNKINPDTGRHYTQAEIARLYGVSRAYVSIVKARAPKNRVSRTPSEIAKDNFPIKNCPHPVSTGSTYKLLRSHGIYVATPKALNEDKLTRLRSFHRRLVNEGLIVEYDPAIEPSPDNVFGYFEYRPRVAEDGDLILRDNDYVEYTPTGRRIYRLPSTAI